MAGLIGQQLGQYEIIALLGKGGMAMVYRARQASIERDVAIKIIKPDLSETADFMKRFQQEAKTVASLSHPHILKVFDYGQQGDLAYLVTELLPGGDLAELISKGPMSLDQAARLLDQITSALDYAHQKGIVHRDLKPHNVLLDEAGNVFLTDFGIAKLLDQSNSLTQSGTPMGTPAYMSPEQWSGETIDARADIYSLGIMLFEMLSGKLPFQGDTPYHMMHKHVYETPPPIRSIQPDLPAGIEQVIKKALAKDREQRFKSAAVLAAAFKEAVPGSRQTLAQSTLTAKPYEETQILPRRIPAPKSVIPINAVLAAGFVVVIAGALFLLSGGRTGSVTDNPTVSPTASPVVSTAVSVAASPTSNPTSSPTDSATKSSGGNKPGSGSGGGGGSGNKSATTAAPKSAASQEASTAVATGAATSVAMLPNASRSVITVGNAEQVSLQSTLQGHEADVNSAVFSPDGTILASISDDKTLRLWDMATLKQTAVLEGHTDRARCVAFSPDGKLVASGALDYVIRLWDVKTGKQQAVLEGHKGDINSVAFSPDGTLIASASRDNTVRLWDVATGKQQAVLEGHTDFVRGVAFSPDGTLLASASFDKTVRLWDTKTGKEQNVLQGHTGKINAIAFSPDGTLLASGSDDTTIRIWEVKTGKALPVLQGHTNRVFGVAFSPDGTLLASASADKTVRLWDLKASQEKISLKGHLDAVRGVSFSPDGRWLVSAASDKTIRLWAAVGSN